MIDRERLTNLVQDATKGCARYWASLIANHLIENGIILPPIKLGDSVWDIYYTKPREWKVVYIGYNGEDFDISLRFQNGARARTKLISGKHINRIYFLSKEDAIRSCML